MVLEIMALVGQKAVESSPLLVALAGSWCCSGSRWPFHIQSVVWTGAERGGPDMSRYV